MWRGKYGSKCIHVRGCGWGSKRLLLFVTGLTCNNKSSDAVLAASTLFL